VPRIDHRFSQKILRLRQVFPGSLKVAGKSLDCDNRIRQSAPCFVYGRRKSDSYIIKGISTHLTRGRSGKVDTPSGVPGGGEIK